MKAQDGTICCPHPKKEHGIFGCHVCSCPVGKKDPRSKRLDRLRLIERLDTPWPLVSILKKLADAGEHLLDVHNCDDEGHEGIRIAVTEARKIITDLGE